MFLKELLWSRAKSHYFKTSISRNHAYRVLHSRFPPFGFVLKPVWSMDVALRELLWIRVKVIESKLRFRETMPIVFSIIDFPQVCTKARLVQHICFRRIMMDLWSSTSMNDVLLVPRKLYAIPFENEQFWNQKSILKGVPLSGPCPP